MIKPTSILSFKKLALIADFDQVSLILWIGVQIALRLR